MNIIEFSNIFKKKLTDINIMLNGQQIESFYKYMNLLIEWNKKINLTTIVEPEDIILKHFIDSLTILSNVNESDYIVDVGTGAGFPGIPIKIALPNTKIVLLDSLNKRIIFLNEVISELKLNKIETIHSRVEDFAQKENGRKKFDIATARAVSNLSTILEYMMPLIKNRGKAICMKGSNIEDELKNSKKAIEILGGKIKNVKKFCLAQNDMERNIIVIEKIKNTPKEYPRKAGIPSKNPIK